MLEALPVPRVVVSMMTDSAGTVGVMNDSLVEQIRRQVGTSAAHGADQVTGADPRNSVAAHRLHRSGRSR